MWSRVRSCWAYKPLIFPEGVRSQGLSYKGVSLTSFTRLWVNITWILSQVSTRWPWANEYWSLLLCYAAPSLWLYVNLALLTRNQKHSSSIIPLIATSFPSKIMLSWPTVEGLSNMPCLPGILLGTTSWMALLWSEEPGCAWVNGCSPSHSYGYRNPQPCETNHLGASLQQTFG